MKEGVVYFKCKFIQESYVVPTERYISTVNNVLTMIFSVAERYISSVKIIENIRS
jgi:hypothetical protein